MPFLHVRAAHGREMPLSPFAVPKKGVRMEVCDVKRVAVVRR